MPPTDPQPPRPAPPRPSPSAPRFPLQTPIYRWSCPPPSIEFHWIRPERSLSTKCSTFTSCRRANYPCSSYEFAPSAVSSPNSISCTAHSHGRRHSVSAEPGRCITHDAPYRGCTPHRRPRRSGIAGTGSGHQHALRLPRFQPSGPHANMQLLARAYATRAALQPLAEMQLSALDLQTVTGTRPKVEVFTFLLL